jgi:hypothetical protein
MAATVQPGPPSCRASFSWASSTASEGSPVLGLTHLGRGTRRSRGKDTTLTFCRSAESVISIMTSELPAPVDSSSSPRYAPVFPNRVSVPRMRICRGSVLESTGSPCSWPSPRFRGIVTTLVCRRCTWTPTNATAPTSTVARMSAVAFRGPNAARRPRCRPAGPPTAAPSGDTVGASLAVAAPSRGGRRVMPGSFGRWWGGSRLVR